MRWTNTLIATSASRRPKRKSSRTNSPPRRPHPETRGRRLYLSALGLRALRKIEQIVREEMDRAGAIEVLMPALQPPEIWQQSGTLRNDARRLFKAHDSARREWVLGPTHEEVITLLVAAEINSYRQLPKNFYQIQVKFRDEIRPRFA